MQLKWLNGNKNSRMFNGFNLLKLMVLEKDALFLKGEILDLETLSKVCLETAISWEFLLPLLKILTE